MTTNSMDVFDRYESEVRSYCRSFPVVFDRGSGATLHDEAGRRYLDFFAGAGALSYGHNNAKLKQALLEYIERDGVTHSLDMATSAKRRFLERFSEVILRPRGLDYKVQFPGPTGTNAVEAALKLARKVTGRHTIVAFTNAFHGMTLGSLSITGNSFKRHGAGVPLNHACVMPYDGYFPDGADTLAYFEAMLQDGGSGMDLPAAVILETVQAEGGINVASMPWLTRLAEICQRHDVLLIVDDIQVGCGRTGTFFSFEPAGIQPDIVCLSKSLSGYGVPFALTLFKRSLDQWSPGEHNGTFRGHNLAFVTATSSLEYWETDELAGEVARKAARARSRLEELATSHPELELSVRGRGLIVGLVSGIEGLAKRLSKACFERGLICETAGPDDGVLKLIPPLTIDDSELTEGLDIIAACVRQEAEAAGRQPSTSMVA